MPAPDNFPNDTLLALLETCEDICHYLDNPESLGEATVKTLQANNYLVDPQLDAIFLDICFSEAVKNVNITDANRKQHEDSWLSQVRNYLPKSSWVLFSLLAQKQALMAGKIRGGYELFAKRAAKLYEHAKTPALEERFRPIIEKCKETDKLYLNQKV